MPLSHFEAPDPCLDSRRMDVFGAWDGEEDFENEYSEEDWEDEDVEEEFVEDAEDQETESAQQMEVSAEHVKDVEHVQVVVPEVVCEYPGVVQTLETCKDPLRLVEDVTPKACAEDKPIDAALSPSRTKEAHPLPCKGLLTVPSPLRARAFFWMLSHHRIHLIRQCGTSRSLAPMPRDELVSFLARSSAVTLGFALCCSD